MPSPSGLENHEVTLRLLIAAGMVPMISGCRILQYLQPQKSWVLGLARYLVASSGSLNRQVDMSFACQEPFVLKSLMMKNGAKWILMAFFTKNTSERYCIFGSGLQTPSHGKIISYTCFSQKAGWMVKLRLAERGAQHKPKDGRDMFFLFFIRCVKQKCWKNNGSSRCPICQYGSMLAYPQWQKYLTCCKRVFVIKRWTMATLKKPVLLDTISDVNNLGMPPCIVLPFCQGLDCRFERGNRIFLVWTRGEW